MKTIFLIIVVYFIFGVQPSNHQENEEQIITSEFNFQTIDDTMVYSSPLLENKKFTKIDKACIDDTCFTQLITNDLVEIKNSLIELNKELENY